MKCAVNADKQLTFTAGNALDMNGNEFVSMVDGLSDLKAYLAKQYTLSTTIPINPTILRFEQSANVANWFVLDASVK